jgi:hypothetical protein
VLFLCDAWRWYLFLLSLSTLVSSLFIFSAPLSNLISFKQYCVHPMYPCVHPMHPCIQTAHECTRISKIKRRRNRKEERESHQQTFHNPFHFIFSYKIFSFYLLPPLTPFFNSCICCLFYTSTLTFFSLSRHILLFPSMSCHDSSSCPWEIHFLFRNPL